MDEATTRLTVDTRVPGYWRVTLDHPPINTVDDLMYDEVFDLVQAIDAEPALKVVTFESANRDYFLAHYGLTFAAFCRGRRLGDALASIREGGSIDEAVFDSGYASHSGFRDAFARVFGAPPGRAAAVTSIVMGWIDSPLGPLVLGANPRGVCVLADYLTMLGLLEREGSAGC